MTPFAWLLGSLVWAGKMCAWCVQTGGLLARVGGDPHGGLLVDCKVLLPRDDALDDFAGPAHLRERHASVAEALGFGLCRVAHPRVQ